MWFWFTESKKSFSLYDKRKIFFQQIISKGDIFSDFIVMVLIHDYLKVLLYQINSSKIHKSSLCLVEQFVTKSYFMKLAVNTVSIVKIYY